jgi:uridine kinase
MDMTRDIVERLRVLHRSRPTVLVAIDGPGGAGKSALAGRLADDLAATGINAHIVRFDDFFLPSAERSRVAVPEKPVGGDFDWARLRDQVLAPIRAGRPALYARYDWDRDALTTTRAVPAGGIVIVEGVYCSRRELASGYDLRIWVDCPREIRLARGLERDGEEARSRWEDDWMPSEDRYVREHRPHELADLIVDTGPEQPA